MADTQGTDRRDNRYGPGNLGRSTILPDIDLSVPMPRGATPPPEPSDQEEGNLGCVPGVSEQPG
jgi:hypothetical protein